MSKAKSIIPLHLGVEFFSLLLLLNCVFVVAFVVELVVAFVVVLVVAFVVALVVVGLVFDLCISVQFAAGNYYVLFLLCSPR